MSVFPPRTPYSERELKQLYPSDLQLQQVQILFRHGERAPTSVRFEHAGLPAFWPYCSAAKQLLSVTLNGTSSNWSPLQWRRHLETFDSNDNPVVVSDPRGEIDVMCNVGELTDQGRRSSYALGTHLRHLYIDQLGFLPSTIEDPEMIYLRATRIPRAIESLQETFGGMYPQQYRAKLSPSPAIVLRAPADETLNPNNGYCKRFAELAQAFARKSADKWNTSAELDYVNSLIDKWMPKNSKRVAIDSQPRLSGILDTINSTIAHGPETRLPKEFYDHKSMAIMNRLVIEEWFSGYSESQEYRALGIGSLMGDIVSRMVVSVERTRNGGILEIKKSNENSLYPKDRKLPIRLGLSGCHDTTIAAILTSLGAFKLETWPQYTSHIAIELFRKLDTPKGTASRLWKPDKHSSTEALGHHNTISGLFHQVFGINSSGGPIIEPRDDSISPRTAHHKLDNMSHLERSDLSGYYVRIRYNDEPVTVPGCKAPGKHLETDESFCTLESFKAIVDKFTPSNWKKDCGSNLRESAFPARPEPAGY